MGTHYRYAVAFLIAILAGTSSAAVRTKATTSVSAAVKNTSTPEVSADFQTPNGALKYYGPEKYYSLDNSLNAQGGSSVGPTVRPVPTSVGAGGTTSFPYGPGSYTGQNTNPVHKVKPAVSVPKTKLYPKLRNMLKVNPAQIAGQVAIGAAIAGVGWLLDPENNKIQKKQDMVDGMPASPASGFSPQSICGVKPASETLGKITTLTYNGVLYAVLVLAPSPGPTYNIPSGYTLFGNNCTQQHLGYTPINGGWPISRARAITVNDVVSLNTDMTDADWPKLDTYLDTRNGQFIDSIVRETCSGSSSPDACFEEMRGNDYLSGPSSLAGPSSTRTTTTTNTDGSTSTTTHNTTTNYTFNYGSNYFDTNTTTTITTTKDGQIVSTETQQDTSTPTETPPEPEPEPEYTFADTPMPDVPSFYTQKYPDGLSGVWDDAKADFEQSEFMNFLHSFVPSFSGTCPSWSMSFSIGNMAALGSHEFANLCYVFDFIKVCMLLGAVFLSRALIFGG